MKTSSDTARRTRLLVVAGVAVMGALFVRIWHDRHIVSATAAVADLERRVHDHPDDERALLAWGDALHGMKRLDEAEAAFTAAAKLAPTDPRPLNALGFLAVERKQPLEALRRFYASLQRNPRDADIWRSAAQLLTQEHNVVAAKQAYAHAVELNPKDAVSWREMGMLEHTGEAPARALEDIQRAAVLDPADPITQNVLGDAALDDGKLAVAKQAFDKALSLRPDNREALLGEARVTLFLDPSPAGLTRAGKQIDQAIADQPTARAYLARGQWNLLQHRYPPAVSDLKTAVKLEPRLFLAHSFLSQAYAALGQPQLARRESAAFVAAQHPTPALPFAKGGSGSGLAPLRKGGHSRQSGSDPPPYEGGVRGGSSTPSQAAGR